MFKARKHSLKIDMRGLRRHNRYIKEQRDEKQLHQNDMILLILSFTVLLHLQRKDQDLERMYMTQAMRIN